RVSSLVQLVGPAEEAVPVGGFLVDEVERRHRYLGRPAGQPQAQRRAVLDFLIAADDRLARTTEQAARLKGAVGANGEVVVAVVRREEQQGQVRFAPELVEGASADLGQSTGGIFGGGQGGGKRHGDFPSLFSPRRCVGGEGVRSTEYTVRSGF